MPDSLLVLYVDVEVANHHDAAIRANAFLPAAELPRLHVALHDVHAIFLVEGDPGDLVEADDVVLADEPALTAGVVDEHACDRRLTARYQMRVRGNLLEEVTLAGAAGTEFHHVEVALDERNHPQQGHVARAWRELTWL